MVKERRETHGHRCDCGMESECSVRPSLELNGYEMYMELRRINKTEAMLLRHLLSSCLQVAVLFDHLVLLTSGPGLSVVRVVLCTSGSPVVRDKLRPARHRGLQRTNGRGKAKRRPRVYSGFSLHRDRRARTSAMRASRPGTHVVREIPMGQES